MNFIKHWNGGNIVQEEKITVCKHMDSIQTKLRIIHEENLIEDLMPKDVEIYKEINLEIENNLI